MFGLLKTKNSYEQEARDVYAAALAHSIKPFFYEDYKVPDTFDGRFDCLLVQLFIVIERMLDDGHEDFNQALFDTAFANMDQTLREMGIGDMGVPKHQRKMMKAFNGRMHAYKAALDAGDMSEALAKNLYGTVEDVDGKTLKNMDKYVKEALAHLRAQDADVILSGQVEFLEG